MAPDSSPTVRIDREWLNAVEMDAFEAMLHAIWAVGDALTLSRGMYGQIVLSPEEAAAKRAAQMQNGGQ